MFQDLQPGKHLVMDNFSIADTFRLRRTVHRPQKDPAGKKIDGFSADDFDVFTRDSTCHTLSWRGNSNLSKLKGKRIMLRMAMVHSQIYSFTI